MQSFLQFRRLRNEVARNPSSARSITNPAPPGSAAKKTVRIQPEDPLSDSRSIELTPPQHATAACVVVRVSNPPRADEKDDDDLVNPRLWSYRKRLWATSLIFLLVFALGWNSTCDSNITAQDSTRFGVSQEAETIPTALFLLGISLGSLFAGPISETVGRNMAFLVSTSTCMCFTLGSALAPNYAAQVVFRFLAGLASSPTLSMYGGSLADLFTDQERATVWPIFALSPILGPVASPIATGWIAGHLDWRWVYWISLLLTFPIFIVALLFLPETFSPLLQEWKALHLDAITNTDRHSNAIGAGEPFTTRLLENVSRPAKFFTTEPIIIFLGAYLVLIYVVNFTFLSGFSFIFGDTHALSEGISALGFVGIVVGALANTLLTPLYGKAHAFLLHRQKHPVDSKTQEILPIPSDPPDIEINYEDAQTPPPELRLLPATLAAPLLAISLFWLAWTAYPSISPLSGFFATGVFGYALAAIFVSSYQYIIDSYEIYSSSALASVTVARYFFSAGMIVATRPMYQGIGVHWSLTLLGLLAVVLVPVPFWLMIAGRGVRRRSEFARKDDG